MNGGKNTEDEKISIISAAMATINTDISGMPFVAYRTWLLECNNSKQPDRWCSIFLDRQTNIQKVKIMTNEEKATIEADRYLDDCMNKLSPREMELDDDCKIEATFELLER